MKLHHLAFFLGLHLTAQADFLYHDLATTDGGEFSTQFLIENLRNGGYSSPTDTEDASVGAANLSYATTNGPAGGYPVTITLDFVSPASLEKFYLWNHSNSGSSGATNQGVDAFTLTFYDGPGGTGSQIGASFSDNAAKAPATGNYVAETFSFSTSYDGVRSIVFTANNHNPSSNFVAMREIAFEGTTNTAFLYHDTATTTGGEFSGSFPIGNLKNAGHTAATDTENAADNSESYATTNGPTGGYPVTITLEFEVATTLDAFHLWNHSNNNGGGAPASGVKDFSLTFYDGAAGTGSQVGSVYSSAASAAPSTGTYAAETFNFPSTYTGVRSVELTITSRIGGGTSFVAARELGFTGAVNFLYHDSATTTGGEFSGDFEIEKLTNAGHTSAADTEDAADAGESYATTNPATGGYPVTITLDFDATASLDAFHLWNHSNANGGGAPANGVGNFSLAFYDGPGGTGSQIGSTFSDSASAAPATGTYPAETFPFGTSYAGVRSVVFTIINKQGGATSGFVAMREIGFAGITTGTPTPPTPPNPAAAPDKVIVYLVGGQSNADGYGVTSELSSGLQAPQSDVDFYHANAGGSSSLTANEWILLQPGSGSKPGNANGFGPELSFGVGMHNALGSERARIAVIKHTLGGSSLHADWIAGGDGTTSGDGLVYQAFQSTVSSALASLAAIYPDATIQLEGMIWHQGEADTGSDPNATAYGTNLGDFIDDIRATYGSGTRFGIAQLSDNQTSLDPTRLATVKLAQATVADASPLSYLVTTDDQPMGGASTIHFGTTGVLAIGTRFADGMRLVPINDTLGGSNGLDDAWEELYWGTGNAGQDPGGNDDLDSLTNLEEFLWLTNPLVGNVIAPQLQTTPELSITWPSSPERRYLIEASLNLEDWVRLDSFIPGSAGATTNYVLPVEYGGPSRFFRVGVQR